MSITETYHWAFETRGVVTYEHFTELTVLLIRSEHKVYCDFGSGMKQLTLANRRTLAVV